MSLLDARQAFFKEAQLGDDGGYSSRWVKVEFKPFPLYFPNSDARRRAVKLHDLHHIATGYGGDWTGEVEIAAWELASGCGRHLVAWVLNLGAFVVGLVIAPRRLWRAFRAGRRALNLYHVGFDESALRTTTVGALRNRLNIPKWP